MVCPARASGSWRRRHWALRGCEQGLAEVSVQGRFTGGEAFNPSVAVG